MKKFRKITIWVVFFIVLLCTAGICFRLIPTAIDDGSESGVETRGFWLTIGADGVRSIELTMPDMSGGCTNADGSLFRKGERVWLDNLEGYGSLRGLTIAALDADGAVIWTASVPDTDENDGFTRLTIDDWTITNIR